MKVKSVSFRPQAVEDISEIYEYVFQLSQSLTVARQYADRIYSRWMALGHAPLTGRLRPDIAPDLRSVSMKRSVTIYYRVEIDRVRVVRVLHKGRTWPEVDPIS